MRNEKEIIEVIKQTKIVAILRGIDSGQILRTAQALLDGGIKVMEITLNREDALKSIEMVYREFGSNILFGAGTVLTEQQVIDSHRAGACFVVSPNTDKTVIEQSKNLEMVSIPGALTPSEIVRARNFGADFVKVFPAGSMSASYIKAVRAPLDGIPLLAVGGINLDNMMNFIDAGAMGVGIGGNLADKSLIKSGKYDEIKRIAREYVKKLEGV